MVLKRQRINKKGVAIFFVLFVMMFLGILFIQFYSNSMHAQRTAHRFHTSEMARQLAAAGQEEAFNNLWELTNNIEAKDIDAYNDSDFFRKIVKRTILMNNFDRSKSAEIDIPVTKQMAIEAFAGDVMDIKARVGIVDYRDKDADDHHFYGDEGIGTIEIVVTATAKEKYKKKYPGSCTIVRHHDYKVVSMLSKKDNRSSYADSSVLDYVMFLRKGQNEFQGNTQTMSFNVNPPGNRMLTINAGEESSSYLGKVHLGTDNERFTFLNISGETKDFIPDASKTIQLDSLTAYDVDVDKFYPGFIKGLRKELVGKSSDDVKVVSVNSVTGHKALFEYSKLPITDDYINNDLLKGYRNQAAINAMAFTKTAVNISGDDNMSIFYDGIKIEPKSKLSEILDSDIRKQFFNFGYFRLDLSECVLHLTLRVPKFPSGHKNINKDVYFAKEEPEEVEKLKKELFPSFNPNILAKKYSDNYKEKGLDFVELYKHVTSHEDGKTPSIASRAFTFINNEYAYGLEDKPAIHCQTDFYNNEYIGGEKPENSQYPFAHFNLYSKRYINYNTTSEDLDELIELGIYDEETKTLNLRGIIHCSNPGGISLGGITIKGTGVLIARGITISGPIKKDNPNSICVLFARNGNIKINTNKDEEIQASLIAMRGPSGDDAYSMAADGYVVVNDALNLKGSLAADYLNLNNWNESKDNKITYDLALAPTKDVYQINLARWVTFERVIENEE